LKGKLMARVIPEHTQRRHPSSPVHHPLQTKQISVKC
jgi:hypothetical protein